MRRSSRRYQCPCVVVADPRILSHTREQQHSAGDDGETSSEEFEMASPARHQQVGEREGVPDEGHSHRHSQAAYLPSYSSLVGTEGSLQSELSDGRPGCPKVSRAAHERLLRWSTRVITFLNNLTLDPTGQVTLTGQPKQAAMPISAFAKPKALAFVFRKSYGFLGVGVLTEIGFITKKLVHPDGSMSWSAPYFLRSRGYSVGLTIGRLQSGYCLALLNDEAVDRILASEVKFGANFRFFVDMDGAYVRPVRIDSTNETDNVIEDGHGGMIAKYFRLDAMMIDVTFTWAKNFSYQRLNDAVYGAEMSADEVMGGTVCPPAEFEGVIDLLNRLSAAGDAKRRGKGTHVDRSFSNRGNRTFSAGRDRSYSAASFGASGSDR